MIIGWHDERFSGDRMSREKKRFTPDWLRERADPEFRTKAYDHAWAAYRVDKSWDRVSEVLAVVHQVVGCPVCDEYNASPTHPEMGTKEAIVLLADLAEAIGWLNDHNRWLFEAIEEQKKTGEEVIGECLRVRGDQVDQEMQEFMSGSHDKPQNGAAGPDLKKGDN